MLRMETRPSLLRFESFELDVRSRELRKGNDRIRLQEQPFAILRMMLERPGDAVKRLRAALGDDAVKPRFVETLPRRGYRFIGSIADDDVGAAVTAAPVDYK